MKSKFTPGPWVRDLKAGYVCDVRASSGRKIAVTGGMTNSHSQETWEENNANAHLIAAAPELLHACEGALNALRLSPHVDKQQAIDYLIEVIKKARGEKEGEG